MKDVTFRLLAVMPVCLLFITLLNESDKTIVLHETLETQDGVEAIFNPKEGIDDTFPITLIQAVTISVQKISGKPVSAKLESVNGHPTYIVAIAREDESTTIVLLDAASGRIVRIDKNSGSDPEIANVHSVKI